MENTRNWDDFNADELRAYLARADQSGSAFAAKVRLPPEFYPALAVALSAQITAAALGIAAQSVPGIAVSLAGVAFFFAAAGFLLYRFQQANGVRINGLITQVLFITGGPATLIYLGAFAAAVWAAFESAWWLVLLAAAVGGIGCTLSLRRWWGAYRRSPEKQEPGASALVFAGIAAAVFLGLLALVVVS